MEGEDDAAAGSRLAASPTLPSTAGSRSSEPCGELAAVACPSTAGDRAAVAGTAGRRASWLAEVARLLWLTNATSDSEHNTQLPDPCPALAGAK